ncbi:hypothetical protein Scel_41470 [Streptomyces cellostaticus]|nr:hypothetical protein Scel_41470 [Streptomyces cellostaticus]
MGLRQRFHAVGDRRDLIPLQAQGTLQGMTDGTIVFGEQHSLGHVPQSAKASGSWPGPDGPTITLFTALSPSHRQPGAPAYRLLTVRRPRTGPPNRDGTQAAYRDRVGGWETH